MCENLFLWAWSYMLHSWSNSNYHVEFYLRKGAWVGAKYGQYSSHCFKVMCQWAMYNVLWATWNLAISGHKGNWIVVGAILFNPVGCWIMLIHSRQLCSSRLHRPSRGLWQSPPACGSTPQTQCSLSSCKADSVWERLDGSSALRSYHPFLYRAVLSQQNIQT